MDFLDAFDDDFDYTARSTRPVPFSLEQLQRAVCGSDKAQVEAMSGVGLSAAEPALAGEWATLCQQVRALRLQVAARACRPALSALAHRGLRCGLLPSATDA